MANLTTQLIVYYDNTLGQLTSQYPSIEFNIDNNSYSLVPTNQLNLQLNVGSNYFGINAFGLYIYQFKPGDVINGVTVTTAYEAYTAIRGLIVEI